MDVTRIPIYHPVECRDEYGGIEDEHVECRDEHGGIEDEHD
jgi:hypothetical protein